ncbi:hypothetical protein DW266_11855 [Blautia sp. AM22-22LB]|nr:hypothetical protein DW177_03235 [Blautia sp. AM16-16B]RHN99961.1 hypothetical protein DW266_11855 [Blautia sp. AM22-22LB]RHS57120.1 hypothetical protein DW961_07565 [Blautia sp. AM46-3MH]
MIKIKGNVCTGLILTTIYKINMVKKNNKYQTIGIESYNFNAEKEKRLYRYLSMKTMKKKEYGMFLEDLRELKTCDNIKSCTIISYSEWKKYIIEKYESCTIEQLENFSAYLKLGYEKETSEHEGLNIVLAAYMAGLLSIILQIAIKPMVGVDIRLITFLIMCLLLIPCIYMALKIVMKYLYDNNTNSNLYKDYKKIIDELIEKKYALK